MKDPTMNLNATHRTAFVRAVIADVPRVDYNVELKALIQADDLAQLPKEIAAIYRDSKLRPYLVASRTRSAANDVRIKKWNDKTAWGSYAYMSGVAVTVFYEPSADGKKKIAEVYRNFVAQEQKVADLEGKVYAAIGGCRTLKQAHEQLPEFKKYLPEAEVKGTMLPAIANLAADLVKMGWPAGGKKAVTA